MFPTKDKELLKLLSQSKILVKGSGNYICRRLREDEELEDALLSEGISIAILGNDNRVELDRVKINYIPEKQMNGLRISIGGGPDDWLEDDVFRTADHCRFTIGENTQFNGAMLYVQDDDSHICIGKNTMFSWGIDVLVYGCTYHL